MTYGIYELLT